MARSLRFYLSSAVLTGVDIVASQRTPDRALSPALELYRAGRFAEAERLCRKFLRTASQPAAGLQLLGAIAVQTGRYTEAVDCLVRAAGERPADPDIRNLLGVAYLQLDRVAEAIASLQAALHLRSRFPEAQCTLGVALAKAGRADEAVAAFREALRGNPDQVQAHFNLAGILAQREQPADAIAHYRAVLRLEPGNALAHHELGRVLGAADRSEDALAHFREAARLAPSYTEARHSIGIALVALRRWDEAVAQFQETLRLEPQSPDAHHNLGSALLLLGRLEEGFEQYEWRWQLDVVKPYARPFRQPLWRGEDLAGRALLIHDEQGLGDALQCSRYVPMIARRCATVHLEVQPELVKLFEVSLACPTLQILPRVPGFPGVGGLPETDYQCPLMSLPRAFGTTLDSIPAEIPYLHADPARAAAWSRGLSSLKPPRVGLVWAGRPTNPSDRLRSITLELLAPLAEIPGISFVSLQKGEAAAEAATPPPGMVLHDFGAELQDFADTAALVSTLDLVIGVDTAVAHLAGALGKPVWLMNRFHSDWRWLTDREDSPWYPTMRIFRQPRHGDWNSVIARVAGELRRLVP